MQNDATREKPAGGSTITKVAFAGWWYERDGKAVGPLATEELLVALFRREVDPDCRVYRIRQKGREYAVLLPPLQPLGTICCDITPLPRGADRAIPALNSGSGS